MTRLSFHEVQNALTQSRQAASITSYIQSHSWAKLNPRFLIQSKHYWPTIITRVHAKRFLERKFSDNSLHLACVQPPLPSKKSETSVCDLPLIIVFKDHLTFSGMCGKRFDWLFLIHHYITEIARFDSLSFSRALQSEPFVQNLSLSFATIIWCAILTMSSCVLSRGTAVFGV